MSRGLNCPHCKKWVDRDMCHISQICPYCGGRMTDLAVAQRVYYESDDVDDDDPDPVQSGVDTAILAVSLLETVFDDHHTVVDDDPSFQGGGGGDFGGGGADDSW